MANASGIWISKFPSVDIPEVTLHGLLFDAFEKQADKIAAINAKTGEEWTFGRWMAISKAVAAGLTAAGVGQGDVAVVSLPNLPVYFPIVFGSFLTGAAVAPADMFPSDAALENIMTITQPKVWFCFGAQVERITAVSQKLGLATIIVVLGGDAPEGTTTFKDFQKPDGAFTEATDPNAIALLGFSSNTAGLPKAVAMTHKNLVSNVQQVMAQPDHSLGFNDSSTLLSALPMHSVAGVALFLCVAPLCGSRIVTFSGLEPSEFMETFKKYKVTVAHAPVPVLQLFLQHPSVEPVDGFKEVVCNADRPFSAETVDALKAKLNLDLLRQGYGMEETALVAVGDKKNPKAGAVGLLLPNLELKLINPDDGQAITDRNQPGEMWIRGPSVMQGYHKNKETTDQCIDSDGFFHTGDVAYMDEDDQLCLVDNIKGLIKVKGFQVDPVELETHLLTHPKIGDAAVIGVAAANHGGERGDGQLPKALVVKKDDSLTEDEVMDFVKNDFVENKRLAVVEFIDAIPKSAGGKILRIDLHKREEAAAQGGCCIC